MSIMNSAFKIMRFAFFSKMEKQSVFGYFACIICSPSELELISP